ncbi:MAG: maleylacetoacetate isomerase [Alphaproteobacteria bacterium]
MKGEIVLYDYWRSSASYRVRIALNLLGLSYKTRSVDLLSAANRSAEYLLLNPQGLLPTLVVNGEAMTQSLAIIERLHAATPNSSLLPADSKGQYRVRQLSYAIAMEIHPVCNLGVTEHVRELVGGDGDTRVAWMRHFIGKGLRAFEALLLQGDGLFCYGDQPTMADCCLIPQLYNADRWGIEYAQYSRIARAATEAKKLNAFMAAPDSAK